MGFALNVPKFKAKNLCVKLHKFRPKRISMRDWLSEITGIDVIPYTGSGVAECGKLRY
jgi:hypothetical protein